MGIHWKDGGYSTHVEVHLLVDDEMIPVSQVGPHSFVLREPRRIPLGHAQLLISIDGNEEWHDVVVTAADPTATEMAYF